jgi:hypothetical protein
LGDIVLVQYLDWGWLRLSVRATEGIILPRHSSLGLRSLGLVLALLVPLLPSLPRLYCAVVSENSAVDRHTSTALYTPALELHCCWAWD